MLRPNKTAASRPDFKAPIDYFLGIGGQQVQTAQGRCCQGAEKYSYKQLE
jgi:hypothetical protein